MVNPLATVREWLIEPKYAVWIHVGLAMFWLVPMTVVTLLWLSNSVAFVAWMSLYAIVVAHWSGYQAAQAELRVQRQDSGSSQK
jgi:hypothetical protein